VNAMQYQPAMYVGKICGIYVWWICIWCTADRKNNENEKKMTGLCKITL